MKTYLHCLAVILLALSIVSCSRQTTPVSTAVKEPVLPQKEKSKLWASVSVSQPVFPENWTKKLMLSFGVVNDSEGTVDSGIYKSRLFVNGKEMDDWAFIIGNGPRALEVLAPGQPSGFTYAMGDYFNKPGIYKVRWEGKNFKAPEIMFRVLPKSNK